MNRSYGVAIALGAVLLLAPGAAGARALGVEVWTDRGNDAVYQPGDGMTVKVRTSDDAWLLVYEIDTEGYVRLLHPHRGRAGRVEGRRTMLVPDPSEDVELVVEESVGQSYIVAIASTEPFRPLPWFLRPYSAQEEALGYVGEPDDEEGLTAEGRIVGDPFVAMERIRRRVIADPDDDESFATSYATYYVHTEVRYPRYLCYDCHRPNRWAWWDGFDPYYTNCSVFSFRVNWSWYWGPSYWFGHVPYFVYVYRPDCPPRYTRYFESGVWYSAWDGWTRWCELWGQKGLRRYKTPPPQGYVPPARWKETAVRLPAERRSPPGFLTPRPESRSRDGVSSRLPTGRSRPSIREDSRPRDGSGDRGSRGSGGSDRSIGKPGASRAPAGRTERGQRVGPTERERGDRGRTPAERPREQGRTETRRDSGATRRRDVGALPGAGSRREPDRGGRLVSSIRPDRSLDLRRAPAWREPARPSYEPAREWREPARPSFEPAREWRAPARPSVEHRPAPAPSREAPRVERPRDSAPPAPPRAEPSRESHGSRREVAPGKDKR